MNRAQKREYLRKVRHDKLANICPKCGNKTRHFTVGIPDFSGEVKVVCEFCNETVVDRLKEVKPGIYVRLSTENQNGVS